jgi:hypothetical protein
MKDALIFIFLHNCQGLTGTSALSGDQKYWKPNISDDPGFLNAGSYF